MVENDVIEIRKGRINSFALQPSKMKLALEYGPDSGLLSSIQLALKTKFLSQKSAILFCVMLNLKHLFLYVAPFVGIYYLSISYPKSLFSFSAIKQSAIQVAKLAFLVLAVFGISLCKFASKGK